MKARDKLLGKLGKADLLEMYDQMLGWLGDQQLMKKSDPHYRCIYFVTEDRYCNRDTACAALVFMRQYLRTGVSKWKRKAELARDYVLDVQADSGGYPELRGRSNSDDGSAVNTGIVADSLIRSYELGMKFGQRDLDALTRMADFVMSLEWKPGAFYHDTNHLHAYKHHTSGELLWGDGGSNVDCQNTTALAAMSFLRISDFLRENEAKPKEEWLKAAKRAIKHLLDGQDAEGQWPYLFDIENSGYAKWRDMGHHAMCMFCLEKCCAYPPYKDDAKIEKALRRAGLWLTEIGLLQTKRGTKVNWALNGSALTYFTTEYFFIAAPLLRMSVLDAKNKKFWQHESLELMRYVRNDLWDNPEFKREGPFHLNESGIFQGYAWFGQSMGWVLYYMDHMIENMGWWKK